MPKKNKKNKSDLYHLCEDYMLIMYDWKEEDWEAMVAGANKILEWFNDHKNDTGYLKKAASYTNEYGCTGLHLIVEEYDLPFEVIDTWLKLAPEIAQVKDKYGRLPLYWACSHGVSLKVVMALVEAFPKGAEETDDNGNLPLHCACSDRSSLEVVMALVEAYPKGVEKANGDGELPLHNACFAMFPLEHTVFEPSLEILNFLLEAYPESIDGEENKNKASYCLRRLADEEDDVAGIIGEAVGDEMHLVAKLFVIAFPRYALMPDRDGMIALHHACSNIEYIDIAMVLLDAVPESATITDNLGRTPLQLLIPWATVQDENGMLPLHLQAAHSKSITLSFLKFLIAAYPDSIDVRDNRGMLPFQYAFFNNESLSVDVLMYFFEMNYLQRLQASQEMQDKPGDEIRII